MEILIITASLLFLVLMGTVFREEIKTVWYTRSLKKYLGRTWSYEECVVRVSGFHLSEPFPHDWYKMSRDDLVEYTDENMTAFMRHCDPDELLDLIIESGKGMYGTLQEDNEDSVNKAG